MTPSVISKMLNHIKNIESILAAAAGKAVIIEMLMRLIGELSQPVQNTLKTLVTQRNEKHPKCTKKSSKMTIANS